mgnify:CR=1 FL=1
MLTFKQYLREQILILEERLDKIKDIFKNKINTDHDTMAQHKDSDAIVDHFATHADPTRNKSHTQWIVNRYRQKQFRQEDHPRIKEALSNFDKYKSKLPEKDINKYKSLSDVEDAVQPHLGQTASGKEEKRQIKSEGADLVHSGNGVTIHHIKTEKAACAYGSGTKLCISGRKNNMFSLHSKSGPMFIVQHEGRKYHFHNSSQQFKDEKNIATDISKVHPDIQKEMGKSNHPEVQKANAIFDNPHAKSEHISNALEDIDPRIRSKAIQHPNVTKEHITKALDDSMYDIRKVAEKKLGISK